MKTPDLVTVYKVILASNAFLWANAVGADKLIIARIPDLAAFSAMS